MKRTPSTMAKILAAMTAVCLALAFGMPDPIEVGQKKAAKLRAEISSLERHIKAMPSQAPYWLSGLDKRKSHLREIEQDLERLVAP